MFEHTYKLCFLEPFPLEFYLVMGREYVEPQLKVAPGGFPNGGPEADFPLPAAVAAAVPEDRGLPGR